MTSRVALVVADGGGVTDELDAALSDAGFAVAHHGIGDVMIRPELTGTAELVLVSASLGLKQVALLDQGLAEADSPPAFVVFPQGDYAALEACARSGFDYVMPPFLPALLEERVASCHERSQLSTVVEEIAATVKLREYERDLSIAREFQSGFLPDELPRRGGWEFAARVRPAREVAGDFYDGFELVDGRRIGFLVADVCDKGVGAALFMALIRTLLRHTAEHTGGWSPLDDEVAFGPEPQALAGEPSSPMLSVGASPLLNAVTGTNRYLVRNHQSQAYFATLFFGVLDPVSGLLIYVNGGHNPPVLARHADGEQVLLHPTGPAVGIMEESSYVLGYTNLAPGDVLFVYTDGVVEARDLNGQEFTIGRLREAMTKPTGSAQGLLESVDASLREHVSGADQFDDITMFVLRRSAREAA
jgi:hypothetical protein